ncbi:MAG: radical SAM protein [Leptospirillum sp.]
MSVDPFDPSIIRSELWRQRAILAWEKYRSCTVCPRSCHVDRISGETGTCRTGVSISLSAANLHFGEEPCISGIRGSGTVFLTSCNLSCDFCQNFPISQMDYGKEMTFVELSNLFLGLEKRGAHNINLVTPSHVVPSLLIAMILAREAGLSLPIVYNSNGYDDVEMLRLLDGMIDIYLPDMKYSDDQHARRISKADRYVPFNRLAILEMFRQVGPLVLDENGIAKKGLLIRHLIMPNGIGGLEKTATFIRENLGKDSAISLMAQYFPTNRAIKNPLINRPISMDEYECAMETLFSMELLEGYIQEKEETFDEVDRTPMTFSGQEREIA